MVKEKPNVFINKGCEGLLNTLSFFNMTKQKYKTINVDEHTHLQIKKFALSYQTSQKNLMRAMVKIMRSFKPELKEELR